MELQRAAQAQKLEHDYGAKRSEGPTFHGFYAVVEILWRHQHIIIFLPSTKTVRIVQRLHTHTHTHGGQRMGIATHIERRRGHRHGRSPIWVQSVSLPRTSNPRFFWNQHKIPHNTNLLKTVDPRPKTTSHYYTRGDPQTPCSQNHSQTQKAQKTKTPLTPTSHEKPKVNYRPQTTSSAGTGNQWHPNPKNSAPLHYPCLFTLANALHHA